MGNRFSRPEPERFVPIVEIVVAPSPVNTLTEPTPLPEDSPEIKDEIEITFGSN